MEAFKQMLIKVLVFVALAIPGYLLVKKKELTQAQSGALSKLLMYVGMPFMILKNCLNEKMQFSGEPLRMMGVVAIIGIAYTFAIFFVSTPLTDMEKDEKTKGMMRFCSVFSNSGFLGLPLAEAVFGAGSKEVIVIIVLNIITNVLMYTLGVYLVSGDKNAMSLKKAFLNPVLIAFVIGVTVRLLDVKAYVPTEYYNSVEGYINNLAGLVTPVSMIILGMKMGGVNFADLFKSWKTYYVSALKLVAFPLVIVAFALALKMVLPIITKEVVVGIFLAFGTPTAGLASTFSDNYDGDTQNAVAFTLGSTLLSVITIPVIYWLICLL